MRLHHSLRAPALNVYSTGRGGAGVWDGDVHNPRTESSQWNPEMQIVLRRLASDSRYLGASVTVRDAHVGKTANAIL
jgi:hypothetical protein